MKTFLKNQLRSFVKRYAERMNSHAARFSVKQQKIGLIVFCLLFSIISTSILIETFSEKQDKEKIFEVHLDTPLHIGKNLSMPAPVISKEDFERIEKFKAGIDSAQLKVRPHLMDSIKLFEQLYQSQTKK